jgi:hypothetical protein
LRLVFCSSFFRSNPHLSSQAYFQLSLCPLAQLPSINMKAAFFLALIGSSAAVTVTTSNIISSVVSQVSSEVASAVSSINSQQSSELSSVASQVSSAASLTGTSLSNALTSAASKTSSIGSAANSKASSVASSVASGSGAEPTAFVQGLVGIGAGLAVLGML